MKSERKPGPVDFDQSLLYSEWDGKPLEAFEDCVLKMSLRLLGVEQATEGKTRVENSETS